MGEIAKRENLMKFKTVVDLGEKKFLMVCAMSSPETESSIIILDMRKSWWPKIPKNEINSALRLVTTTSVVFIHIRFTNIHFKCFKCLSTIAKKPNLHVWKHRAKITYCWYVFIFLTLVTNHRYCKLVHIFSWLY